MNYEQFLGKLKNSDFEVTGLSDAFCEIDEWEIAFIRMGGRYQKKGMIDFVICARPILAKGLEQQIVKQSKNPHDYPLKLRYTEIGNKLEYKSRLLNFPTDSIDRDADWSDIFEILVNKLPKLLIELGVNELKRQIRSQKELGYVEKIWVES